MKKALLLLIMAPVLFSIGCASKEKRSDESGMVHDTESMERTAEAKLQPVFFDFDKYDLRYDARSTLSDHVLYLKENAAANIQIEGHCDERGSEEYNLALGERRAMAIRDYLTSNGISSSRMTFISYGEERPVDPRHSETAWSLNRRGEFVPY